MTTTSVITCTEPPFSRASRYRKVQCISGVDIANGLLRGIHCDANKSHSYMTLPKSIPTTIHLSPRGTSLIDLLDEDRYYPIFKNLCSCLSVAEVVALTRTCKQLSPLYQTLLQRHWKIDPHLRRFVDKPLDFRSQLGKNDALISGSLALQFFERVDWADSDLDVYVQRGAGAESLDNYLLTAEGYKLDATISGDNYSMPYVVETRTYIKTASKRLEVSPRIQLILTWNRPLQLLFSDFSTTATVNFLTWNKAYSIFPFPKFVQRTSYPLKQLTEEILDFLPKYERRGWEVLRSMPEGNRLMSMAFLDRRRVRDRFTWFVDLETEGVERPEEWRDEVIEEGMFQMLPYKSHIEIPGLLMRE